MAFARKGAEDILAFNRRDSHMYCKVMYFDLVVEAWCLSLGIFPVLNLKHTSPQMSGHHGAFLQDRALFAMSIA